MILKDAKVRRIDREIMISNIKFICDPDCTDGWVITNSLQLAVLMRICANWDTATGKEWNYLIDYADKSRKAKRKHGDKWKASLMPEINNSEDRESIISILKLLTNPEKEIIVTETKEN